MAAVDLHIIDANVMFEAANRYYGFSLVPGFWSWLADQSKAGTVRSASMVKDEIDFPPELVAWAKERVAEGFFLDVSVPEIQEKYQEVIDWVLAQSFGPEHIAKFLDGADPWIIAAAFVLKATVVSQEVATGAGSKKIKIPNVCDAFGVSCIDTLAMLRNMSAQL